MKNVDKLDFTVSDVLEECLYHCSKIRKEKFINTEEHIVEDSKNYNLLAKQHKLDEVIKNKVVGFSEGDLKKLYEDKMGKTAVHNPYREKMLLDPKNRICPYCGMNQVSTLDHILPKAQYENLSITPTNLVPSCGFCNNIKGELIPTKYSQPVNLYFDDISSFRWLFVDFKLSNMTNDLSPQYYILQRKEWKYPQLYDNVRFLNERLQLNKRYVNSIVSDIQLIKNYYKELNNDFFWLAMEIQRKTMEQTLGFNNYKTAFYYSLVENKEKVNDLLKQID